MDPTILVMIPLMMLGGLSFPMLAWYIARQKGRNGLPWFIGCAASMLFVPVCGGLVGLLVTAVMPKVGEPLTGPNDKKVLYSAIGFFIAGIAGFAMLVPSLMTIFRALKF